MLSPVCPSCWVSGSPIQLGWSLILQACRRGSVLEHQGLPRNCFPFIRSQFLHKPLAIEDFKKKRRKKKHFVGPKPKKGRELGPRTYIPINKNSQFFATQGVQCLSMVQILGSQLLFDHMIQKQSLHLGINVRGTICKQRGGQIQRVRLLRWSG